MQAPAATAGARPQGARQVGAAAAPVAAASFTQRAELVKGFKELLDMGAITQTEFDAKKGELLGFSSPAAAPVSTAAAVPVSMDDNEIQPPIDPIPVPTASSPDEQNLEME